MRRVCHAAPDEDSARARWSSLVARWSSLELVGARWSSLELVGARWSSLGARWSSLELVRSSLGARWSSLGARWSSLEFVGARRSSLELVGIRTVDPHGPRAARSHELATNLTSYENELQFVRFHIPVRLVARTPRSSFERADNEPNELQKRASILLSDTQTP